MATLRLFGAARLAAGTSSAQAPDGTVDQILSWGVDRFGAGFADLIDGCRIWVNGVPAEAWYAVGPTDEMAVLPPFGGG